MLATISHRYFLVTPPSHPWFLIVDEVGYVPLDPVMSYFFFSLIYRRYEKGEMILTWGYFSSIIPIRKEASGRLNKPLVAFLLAVS